MAQYREIISENDLILQRRNSWLFGTWMNWRNLDEELRVLREHEVAAFDYAHKMQRLRVIAQGNIKTRKEWLQANLIENSDAVFHTPVETSILEEREGVKYPWPNNNKRGNNGGNNNNQGHGKQKGNHNGQQQKGGQHSRPLTVADLLGAGLTMPTKH